MKACNQFIELSFCVVCALAPSALFTLNADPAAGMASAVSIAAESTRLTDRESIHGNVTAKSEASVTVDARAVAVTPTTSCTKDGKPVTLADIRVGDMVKVTATKTGEGSWQAITIEVTAKSATPD